ncbi:MAG: hypothetical protein IPK75_19950 [Acidobacteria bacterium]|nr:hypothetical protein [Acidobacteriota bacterium]
MPLQLKGGKVAAVTTANPNVSEREPIALFDDDTAEFSHLVIGKLIPGSVGVTPFSELAPLYLLGQADRDKLTGLPAAVTGDLVLDLLNTRLGTDVEAILSEHGLTAPAIAAAFDVLYGGDSWRKSFAHSFNGREMDEDGNIFPAADDYAVADITGLTGELVLKADADHGHEISQVTGLTPLLDSKVNASDIGSAITDAVAAAIAGINATSIAYTPAGNWSSVTLSALAAEIDSECERISRKGAVNGYASLNSSGYVPSAQLAPADAAATDSDEISWSTSTANMTVPVSMGEVASQNRRWQRDLTLCTTIIAGAYVSAGSPAPTGSKFQWQYSTAAGGYTNWTSLGAEVMIDGSNGTGQVFGTEVSCPAGAKTATTRIRLNYGGGDGTTSATLGNMWASFNKSTPINTGSVNGPDIVTRINAELGSTAWQSSAISLGDNTVTLAKLVNASAPGLIGRASGSGAWSQLSAADVRTLLGVSTGTPDADAITETATRVFVSPFHRELADRVSNTEKVSTAQVIGLLAPFVDFVGTGTTVITATLTNAARCQWLPLYNWRAANVTIVPEAPCTLQNATGGTITSYTLPPNKAACVRRNGNIYRVIE